jgi:predicted PurR-regulated permease PerM
MHTSSIEKYFLFSLLAIVTILAVAIFYPFITTIVLAGAFAVVLTPLYNWIRKNVAKGVSWLASLFTIVIFLLVLCVPIFFIGTTIFNQAENAYNAISGLNSNGEFIQKLDLSINNIMPNGMHFDTVSKVNELGTFLSNNIGSFFTSTFNSILMFILMIFTIFYLLKDGENWKKSLITLSPLSEENVKEILSKLSSAINRILKGSFLIAIAQGILVGIGLSVFGVPNGALWGALAGISSFIPTVGTSLVSIPAILFLYFTGMQVEALGLLIWSVILVGFIDNLLTPYVISRNTEIPSLFILFSILGGVTLMGPVGVLIGPLVLSLLYSLVSIYRKEIKHNHN